MPIPEGMDKAARWATYRPRMLWLVVAILGWLATAPGNLQPSPSTANLVNEVFGMTMIAFGIRLLWVAVTARGPRFWERVFFSPWAWTIGIVVDVVSAAGRSHG